MRRPAFRRKCRIQRDCASAGTVRPRRETAGKRAWAKVTGPFFHAQELHMTFNLHTRITVGTALAAAALVAAAAGVSTLDAEKPFLAENQTAMRTMMSGMHIRPSGDIDRDFVDMMVPHHQGAIDMAKSVLKYGHNEQIRRMAEDIVSSQQQEIKAMRQAVGEGASP
jgi:hypothetical protein